MVFAEPVLFRNISRRLEQTQLYDWAMRAPIVLYSSLVLARDLWLFAAQILSNPAGFGRLNVALIVAVLARVSFWMFVATIAILPVFRLRPIAKSNHILPRLGALVSACLPPLFMFLERAPADLILNSVSVVLNLAANLLSVVTVSFLGRSFSIMPEARQLVTTGPYAYVRHPLYLCEIVGLVGIILQFRSLAAITLAAVIVLLLLARALWEEAVLADAFPDFAAYRSQTAFLFPRRPIRFFTMMLVDSAAKRRVVLVFATLAVLTASVLAAMWRLAGQ